MNKFSTCAIDIIYSKYSSHTLPHHTGLIRTFCFRGKDKRCSHISCQRYNLAKLWHGSFFLILSCPLMLKKKKKKKYSALPRRKKIHSLFKIKEKANYFCLCKPKIRMWHLKEHLRPVHSSWSVGLTMASLVLMQFT